MVILLAPSRYYSLVFELLLLDNETSQLRKLTASGAVVCWLIARRRETLGVTRKSVQTGVKKAREEGVGGIEVSVQKPHRPFTTRQKSLTAE